MMRGLKCDSETDLVVTTKSFAQYWELKAVSKWPGHCSIFQQARWSLYNQSGF